MAENKIKKIAELSGVSESVVKRALGNYSGINNKTKQNVLEVAEALGVCFKPKNTEIGIVMPTVPTYFWGEMRRALSLQCTELEADFRFFLFSDINNEKDALNCLDVASKSGISVLIVCPPDTCKIRDFLHTLSEKICVIILEEFVDVEGAVFVGENSYDEGFLLAKKYLETFPQNRRFAVLSNRYDNNSPRNRGFFDAAKSFGNAEFLNIYTEFSFDEKTVCARLARKLEPELQKIDCIFCPSGLIDIVSGALVKLKNERVHVVGFDSGIKSASYRKRDFLKQVCAQNLYGQAKSAAEIAKVYIKTGKKPSEKYIFIKNTVGL